MQQDDKNEPQMNYNFFLPPLSFQRECIRKHIYTEPFTLQHKTRPVLSEPLLFVLCLCHVPPLPPSLSPLPGSETILLIERVLRHRLFHIEDMPLALVQA